MWRQIILFQQLHDFVTIEYFRLNIQFAIFNSGLSGLGIYV